MLFTATLMILQPHSHLYLGLTKAICATSTCVRRFILQHLDPTLTATYTSWIIQKGEQILGYWLVIQRIMLILDYHVTLRISKYPSKHVKNVARRLLSIVNKRDRCIKKQLQLHVSDVMDLV